MTAPAQPPSPTPKKGSVATTIGSVGCLALVVGGFSTLMARTCATEDGISEAAYHFVDHLQNRRVEQAHASLSAPRRAVMPLPAFTALTDHRAFLESKTKGWSEVSAWGGGLSPDKACVSGKLVLDEKSWAVELFLRLEGDDWRVHSFAIQPPATVQLYHLLSECSGGANTRAGYRGPAIERSTTPTD